MQASSLYNVQLPNGMYEAKWEKDHLTIEFCDRKHQVKVDNSTEKNIAVMVSVYNGKLTVQNDEN